MASVKKIGGPCPCGCQYQLLEVEGRMGWFPPAKAKKKLADAKADKDEPDKEEPDKDEDEPDKDEAKPAKSKGFWPD